MTTLTRVQATFLHHETAQPVVVDLPACPTCGETGPTCAGPTPMHPARRSLIAPLIGSPGPDDVLALQPTFGDVLDSEPAVAADPRTAEAR